MTKAGRALTRVKLYDAVYRRVGLSRSESSAQVELVLKEIADTQGELHPVRLTPA
jgi:integration host factor subunit alpha